MKNFLRAVALAVPMLLSTGRAEAEPAESPRKGFVPKELEPWVPWVLDGAEAASCPSSDGSELCLWPSSLSLDLRKEAGEFVLLVFAERTSTLVLPGDGELWPEEVTVDGKEALVLGDGTPTTELGRGKHEVRGRFRYGSLPETLSIGADIAFFRVRLDGKEVPLVRRQDGRLWLRELADTEQTSGENESVLLSVHRRVTDGVPLRIETELVFRVSGKVRELTLPEPLLPGTIPLSVTSDLALALAPSGQLRVQLLPGEHRVTLLARAVAFPETLTIGPRPAPWPEQEVWVFEPNPAFRAVELSGPLGVDASRTELPGEWRKWSAYVMEPGSVLSLTTSRRGEAQLPPNRLTLSRELWLDESGEAFTVRDTWGGEMHQGFRLNLLEGTLGGALVDGTPELVTFSTAEPKRAGLELRRSALALVAESRLERTGVLRAIGWNEDVEQLSATLHLPPGWDVLGAFGVDSMPEVWLSRWDLFDFFFVLVMTLAALRIAGPGAAAALLFTLVLCHEREGAPRFLWVPLLAFLALVRFLPTSGWTPTLSGALRVTVLGLLLAAISFSVDEVRGALYPHLKSDSFAFPSPVFEAEPAELATTEGGTGVRAQTEEDRASPEANAADMASAPAQEPSGAPPPPVAAASKRIGTRELLKSASAGMSTRSKYAADVVVQTGPGVPERSATSWSMQWSGPVHQNHEMRLVLVSKTTMRLLTVLRLGALGAAIFLLLRASGTRWPKFSRPGKIAAATAALALALLPTNAHATPSQELLDDLRGRLTRSEACATDCLAVASADVFVDADGLRIETVVHARSTIGYRLPGPLELFARGSLEVDGRPAVAVRVEPNGHWYLRLESGVHRVRLRTSSLADQQTLDLGDAPKRVSVRAQGFVVTGVNERGHAESGSLSIARVLEAKGPEDRKAKANETAGQIRVPAFYAVERSLRLGLTLELTTTLRRLSDAASPETLAYPLLPGEKVTTPGILVDAGKASLSFPREARDLTFTSTLPSSVAPGSKFEATWVAPSTTAPYSEVWKVACTTLWHCTTSGLRASAHTDEGLFAERFEPWPGEALEIRAEVPAPAPGRSLTIERADLELSPGIRLSRGTLELRVHSSRATTHALQLPGGAKLESVTVNGRPEPVRAEGAEVRVPLGAGRSRVVLAWQSEDGLRAFFHTPAVDLGAPAVNVTTRVHLPRERWLLWTFGPAQGPAILFWGYLVLVVAFALLLPRLPRSPLSGPKWFLLGLGLTQIPVAVGMFVVGWFFLVVSRKSWNRGRPRLFNFAQFLLVGATFGFVLSLVGAVYGGLVSSPDMLVQGAGSSNELLVWYADRTTGVLPKASVLSVSLWFYRGLMLAWSLWLAKSLLDWLKWAFELGTEGGFWERKPPKPVAPEAPLAPSSATAASPEPTETADVTPVADGTPEEVESKDPEQ